eukprot:UN05227
MTAQDSTTARQRCGSKPTESISIHWMLFLNWAFATRGLIYVITIAGYSTIFSEWVTFLCFIFGYATAEL